MCHSLQMTDTTITAFPPINTSNAFALANNTKIYHHIHRDISVLSLSKLRCFEKASVYTRTDRGKSQLD